MKHRPPKLKYSNSQINLMNFAESRNWFRDVEFVDFMVSNNNINSFDSLIAGLDCEKRVRFLHQTSNFLKCYYLYRIGVALGQFDDSVKITEECNPQKYHVFMTLSVLIEKIINDNELIGSTKRKTTNFQKLCEFDRICFNRQVADFIFSSYDNSTYQTNIKYFLKRPFRLFELIENQSPGMRAIQDKDEEKYLNIIREFHQFCEFIYSLSKKIKQWDVATIKMAKGLYLFPFSFLDYEFVSTLIDLIYKPNYDSTEILKLTDIKENDQILWLEALANNGERIKDTIKDFLPEPEHSFYAMD